MKPGFGGIYIILYPPFVPVKVKFLLIDIPILVDEIPLVVKSQSLPDELTIFVDYITFPKFLC